MVLKQRRQHSIYTCWRGGNNSEVQYILPQHLQGVVTCIPTVLTPATGIKISSGLLLGLDRLITT